MNRLLQAITRRLSSLQKGDRGCSPTSSLSRTGLAARTWCRLLVAGIVLVIGLAVGGFVARDGSTSAASAPFAAEQQTVPSAQQTPDQEDSKTPAGTVPHVYLGAWVGERVNVPGDVAAFQAAIGKGLAIIHRYSGNPPTYGREFDVAWANSVRDSGSIPMLSWQPGFWVGTSSLAAVAAGDEDDYVTAWADQLRDWGYPIFLRMMWEQNTPWYPWRSYQEPQNSQFIAAWRHLVQVFQTRGATNVTFVWSPHVSGHGASPIMETYPGDDYVDWVALDGYPFRSDRGDFAETFGPDYDLLASSLSKPIMIAETSLDSWSDELKAQRIHEILGESIPNRFPLVRALVWFEEKNTNGIDYSILQDQGPLSQEAFRQEVASSFYAGNDYGALKTSPIPPPDALDGAEVSVRPPTVATRLVESTSENLLVDPGFDEAAAGEWNRTWVVPPWMTSVVLLDSSIAASGTNSMLHSSQKGDSYVIYQDVPAVAGAAYDVSLVVWVEEKLGYGKATLEVQSLNQYGGAIETKPVVAWQETTDGWTRVGGTVTIAKRAVKARVQVKVNSLRGTFRLDDFYFARSRR